MRTVRCVHIAQRRHHTGDPLRAIVYFAAVLERAQLLDTNMLTQERVSLDDYIDGTVSRPFAYRVLLPQILRGINAVTPASAAADLDRLEDGLAGPGRRTNAPAT
jgi:hypothetical protein